MEVNNKYHIRVTDNESGETVHEEDTNLCACAIHDGNGSNRILMVCMRQMERAEACARYIEIIAQLQLICQKLVGAIKEAGPMLPEELIQKMVLSACEDLKEDEHAES